MYSPVGGHAFSWIFALRSRREQNHRGMRNKKLILAQPPEFLTGSRPGEKFGGCVNMDCSLAHAVILLTAAPKAAPHCEFQQ